MLTALGFALLPLVGGFFMIVLKDPELARRVGLISAKARIVAGAADWPTYLGFLALAIAGGGIMLFGLIATWVFGREYSDRTVKDLLALPTSRSTIVLAKFIVVAAWSAALTVMICLIGLGVGAAVGLPQASAPVILNDGLLIAQAACLTIALLTPVAFFASRGARLSGADRFRVSRPVTGAGDCGRGMGRILSLVHPVVGFTGHGFGTRELRDNHPDLRRRNRRHADVVEAGRPDALIVMMIGCTEPSSHLETPMNQPGPVAPHNPEQKDPSSPPWREPDTLAERVASVQARIAAAATPAGRDPASVTLVAVSKTQPAQSVVAAYQSGLRHFGENRVEEATPKAQTVAALLGPDAPVSWHMVGHVQSRKAEGVLPWAGMLHSVESEKLAARLSPRLCRRRRHTTGPHRGQRGGRGQQVRRYARSDCPCWPHRSSRCPVCAWRD